MAQGGDGGVGGEPCRQAGGDAGVGVRCAAAAAAWLGTATAAAQKAGAVQVARLACLGSLGGALPSKIRTGLGSELDLGGGAEAALGAHWLSMHSPGGPAGSMPNSQRRL